MKKYVAIIKSRYYNIVKRQIHILINININIHIIINILINSREGGRYAGISDY